MNRKTTLAITIAGAATLVTVAIGASNAASATETGQTTTHSVVTSVDAPKPALSDEQIAAMNAAKDAAEAPKPALSDEQIAAMNAAKDAAEAPKPALSDEQIAAMNAVKDAAEAAEAAEAAK